MSVKRKKVPGGKGATAGVGQIESMLAFPDAEEVNLFRLRTKEDYERTFISRPNKSYTINWGTQQDTPPQPPLPQQIVSNSSYFVIGWRCSVLWSLAMLYQNPGGLFWNYNIAWRFTGANITPDFNFPLVGGGANQMFNPVAEFDNFPATDPNFNATAHPHGPRFWGLTGCPEKQRFMWGVGVDTPANQACYLFSFFLQGVNPSNGQTVQVVANSTTSAPLGRVAIYRYNGGNKELAANFALTAQNTNTWGYQISDSGWYVPEFIITNNPTYSAGGINYNQLVVQVNYCGASANTPGANGQPLFTQPQTATNIGGACQELSHFEAPDLDKFLPNIRRIRTLTVKGDFACTADSDHNGGQITAAMIQPLQSMEPYLLGLASDVAAEEPHVEFLLRNGISAVPKKSGSEWTKLREPITLNALAAASSSEPIDLDQPTIVVIVSAASKGGATGIFDHYCVYEFTTNVSWLFTQFPGMSSEAWEKAMQKFQAELPTFWWSRKNFAITS
jgi:hypothetical protein